MDRQAQEAFVVALVDALTRRGWAGRTHVHKTVFRLQRAEALDLGFEFVIYHYGPYSFELDEMLRDLRSAAALEVVPDTTGYGAHYAHGPRAAAYLSGYESEVGKARTAIDRVASEWGPRNVRDLERVATALYVVSHGEMDDATAVGELRRVKPHFSEAELREAVREARALTKGDAGHSGAASEATA